ncbi:MAG: DUF1848 domain-containing protein [Nitrospinae bacterium]|nr:DUF1848 domain-containing protein [Nitrospinota bacterium]
MAIISASRRTDIPAFYGDWFMDKVRKGHCMVVNPFNGSATTVSLKKEDVDGIVFWSRNYAPMLKNLRALYGMGYRFYCQCTMLDYPRFLDPATPAPGKSARIAHSIRSEFGPRSVVWRYDPILITAKTDFRWHLERFKRLAKSLEGATDTCVISFVDWYRKLDRNLKPVLAANDASLIGVPPEEMAALAQEMAGAAGNHGMTLESCCEPGLAPMIGKTACIDIDRLSDVTGKDLTSIPKKPTRPACACAESKDIGAYDTCVMGCAYCYANRSRAASFINRRAIKPEDISLSPQARAK